MCACVIILHNVISFPDHLTFPWRCGNRLLFFHLYRRMFWFPAPNVLFISVLHTDCALPAGSREITTDRCTCGAFEHSTRHINWTSAIYDALFMCFVCCAGHKYLCAWNYRFSTDWLCAAVTEPRGVSFFGGFYQMFLKRNESIVIRSDLICTVFSFIIHCLRKFKSFWISHAGKCLHYACIIILT